MGRLACWVIVAGSQSTGFRAATREELLPTLKQLQRTQPDAAVKWFARGRLWDSPTQVVEAARTGAKGRGRSWRPGGAHVDPRDRYKLTRDEKRVRFKKRLVHKSKMSNRPEAQSSEMRPSRTRGRK